MAGRVAECELGQVGLSFFRLCCILPKIKDSVEGAKVIFGFLIFDF